MMESVMNRVRKIKMLDMAILKIYLFCLGLLVGSYFASVVSEYTNILTVIVGVSMAYVIYVFFIKKAEHN